MPIQRAAYIGGNSSVWLRQPRGEDRRRRLVESGSNSFAERVVFAHHRRVLKRLLAIDHVKVCYKIVESTQG